MYKGLENEPSQCRSHPTRVPWLQRYTFAAQAVATVEKAATSAPPKSQYELYTLTTWLLKVSPGSLPSMQPYLKHAPFHYPEVLNHASPH